MKQNPPRLLFAAPSSGSGKTTVTCAVLEAFRKRGLSLASFKCGPDYIDPMFHTKIIGIASRNLDSFFAEADTLKSLFCAHAGRDISVIEGAMGYYDGIALTQQASTFEVAKIISAPVVLVVDCKKMSASVAALIEGFVKFEDDSNIFGVILNNVSEARYPALKNFLEEKLKIKVFGYLPTIPDCAISTRQLGLIPAGEIANLKEKLAKLADQAEKTIDLNALLVLSKKVEEINFVPPILPEPLKKSVRIAVAMDKAFCFYYEDNLDLLKKLGAEIIPFSPMNDEKMPIADGLILGGGYPEVFAKELQENKNLRAEIKAQINNGLFCIAECGGFQYLQDYIIDEQGQKFNMLGVLHGHSFRSKNLRRFGYINLTAKKDTLLCKKGEIFPAHEFHHWDSAENGEACLAQKPCLDNAWNCVIATENLFAGYPHLYFYSDTKMAKRFLEKCSQKTGDE